MFKKFFLALTVLLVISRLLLAQDDSQKYRPSIATIEEKKLIDARQQDEQMKRKYVWGLRIALGGGPIPKEAILLVVSSPDRPYNSSQAKENPTFKFNDIAVLVKVEDGHKAGYGINGHYHKWLRVNQVEGAPAGYSPVHIEVMEDDVVGARIAEYCGASASTSWGPRILMKAGAVRNPSHCYKAETLLFLKDELGQLATVAVHMKGGQVWQVRFLSYNLSNDNNEVKSCLETNYYSKLR